MYDALFYLQRHDIFKKRIDAHSNVIEVKQDGIGAPKVSKKTILWHTSSASIFFLNISCIRWITIYIHTTQASK